MREFEGRTVAITGATGGLGREICFGLARGGADLIFINRSEEKSKILADEVRKIRPDITVETVLADFSDTESVKNAALRLCGMSFDTLVLNAGVYNVPLTRTDAGYNNVFTTNFLTQYYLACAAAENVAALKKVVVEGSIAHRFAAVDENNIDLTGRKQNAVYGNSKKFLMFAAQFLSEAYPQIEVCVAHPGVTLTNMTNHYPAWINWFIRFGIRTVFPSPKKAARPTLCAVNGHCGYMEWYGPSLFNIYGKPKLQKIRYSGKEAAFIASVAEQFRPISEKDVSE